MISFLNVGVFLLLTEKRYLTIANYSRRAKEMFFDR